MNKTLQLPFCSLCALLLLAAGCATTGQHAGIPTYFISGNTYVPLDAFCSSKAIRQEYDGLTRTVSLNKDSASVKFQVGRSDVLLNGRLAQLAVSSDFFKGMVIIPQELRQKIEELFPEKFVSPRVFMKLRKVVVDPGHGGKDPGATGSGGVEEKDVVLDIGRRLRDGLKQEGVEVVMTRSSDVFIPLEKRADIANDAAADLFVSIHANANRAHSLKGFEVYYVSPNVSDTKRALLSAKSDTLNLESSCLLSPSLNLKAILWDMTYAYDRREAIELSRMLCKAMRKNPETTVIGVKNANFSVLRGTTMPAVLVEVGFLTNPSEESLIASGTYRQRLADTIKDGIRYYCEGLGERPCGQPKNLVKEGQ
jgi:N-acetylmuramoyl-L-alanine amidase